MNDDVFQIELTAEISTLVDQLSNLYREKLRDRKASGRLENFTTDISIDNQSFKVIFNLEEYWYYVEHGRKPGKMPPVSAIENWIRIKPVIPDARTGKVPDTKQLAWMIARHIGEYGTYAYYPLHLTQTSQKADNVISAIKQEISKQIVNYIESIDTFN